MKKFFVTLIILIIAGGVVFYFGWIQIQIPAEGYAVLFSKTHGYDDEIIKPGEFVWRWQRLIPTNVKLHIFHPVVNEKTITVEGTLPSGDLYSQYLQGHPDFDWKIEVFLRFSLKPEALPALVRDDFITEETLPGYIDTITAKTESFIYPKVVSFVNTQGSEGELFPNMPELEKLLRTDFSDAFPAVDFLDIQIQSLQVPDLTLYQNGRENYMQITDLENQIRRQETARAAADEVEKSRAIDMLKEYGNVLTDYPVLMDYLKLKGTFNELTPIPGITEE